MWEQRCLPGTEPLTGPGWEGANLVQVTVINTEILLSAHISQCPLPGNKVLETSLRVSQQNGLQKPQCPYALDALQSQAVTGVCHQGVGRTSLDTHQVHTSSSSACPYRKLRLNFTLKRKEKGFFRRNDNRYLFQHSGWEERKASGPEAPPLGHSPAFSFQSQLRRVKRTYLQATLSMTSPAFKNSP